MEPEGSRWWVSGICVFLAVIIWLVFGQTLRHEFVNFDDDQYVYENPVVLQGLTRDGIISVFTHISCANWHPLTMLSHMLDCQIYGVNPGGHHLTNLLLHAATAILLFLVLRRMTGFLWRSMFVAAVFAIHPLRVESVAWVAERKDVLSGLFFMLSLWFYASYVRGVTRDRSQTAGTERFYKSAHYWVALSCFALGLMSKPMLVTLPVVLLLLDYWPLGRMMAEKDGNFSPSGPLSKRLGAKMTPMLRLVGEKLPWFCLSLASGLVTIFAQNDELLSPERFPFALRVGNALVSYVAYLGQTFWPSGLAILYPFPAEGVGILKAVLAAALLVAITSVAFILRRRCPCFLTGWLWYLVMLLPVIGLLQVGWQARADRYLYLPQIGLCVTLTWAAAALCARWRYQRLMLASGAAAILAALILCARGQATYWRNSETLWAHALACTSGNFIAHYNYGVTLFQKGNPDEAIVHYQKALEINSKYEKPYYNLGNILIQRGQVGEAIDCFQNAVQAKPDFVDARNNLGLALFQEGRVDEAIAQYQRALEIQPDGDVHKNLGYALLQQGRLDEAIIQYQKALEFQPEDAKTRYYLGKALQQKNRGPEAIVQYRRALQIDPDLPKVLNNLAWLLAASPDPHIRDGVQAVQYAERACELTHYHEPIAVSTLAAAYAEAGRFDDAIATAQNACALAETAGNQNLLKKNQERLNSYHLHQTYHEPAQ